jgi:hypothetical protein
MINLVFNAQSLVALVSREIEVRQLSNRASSSWLKLSQLRHMSRTSDSVVAGSILQQGQLFILQLLLLQLDLGLPSAADCRPRLAAAA